MSKLKQSGAIVLLSLLIALQYYIFDQQDMVTVTQVAQYSCLQSTGGVALCISCIGRSENRVATQSSVYVKDTVNPFKVVAMASEGLLSCQEIIQFVSYELPMKTARDIKIEELGATKELIKLLDIKVTEQPVFRYQGSPQTSTIALLQLKPSPSSSPSSPSSPSTTIYTYSSLQSQSMTRYYSKFLAEISLIFSIFCIFFYKFQQDEFKVGFVGVIAISLMVLGESMLANTGYLVDYAISLTIGFYFTKGLMSRWLTLFAILVSLGVSEFVPGLYSESLATLLALYVLVGRNKSFKKVGTFTIFCFTIIILCVGFKEHHHWLSLPLRKIMQYTILTFSPLLMQIVSNTHSDANYNKIPTGVVSSANGLSLPGFEEEISSDEQK